MNLIKEFRKDFLLTGGETGPENEMPLTLLVDRIIEMATLHANHLGIGWARMIQDNQAWVLSRLSLEMSRFPRVNEAYRIDTWVENRNRRFSERNFEVFDGDGNTIGYAHTVWVSINMTTREMGDLSALTELDEVAIDRPCPIAKQGRLMVDKEKAQSCDYTFTYRDIDINRHVNTVAYLRLLLDAWSLDFHDKYQTKRLDMAFMKESYWGEKVMLSHSEDEANVSSAIIESEAGDPLIRMKIEWQERTTD